MNQWIPLVFLIDPEPCRFNGWKLLINAVYQFTFIAALIIAMFKYCN